MTKQSLKFWSIYLISAAAFLGVVLFILMWVFGLALSIAAPLSGLILIALVLVASRKAEAPPLVMKESKWLYVDGEKE